MISTQLQSQTFPTRLVVGILLWKGKNVHRHQLRYEQWSIGLWTNYGVISWREIASYLVSEAQNKPHPNYPDYLYTAVEQKGENFFLVPSSQDASKKYAVLRIGKNLSCQCFKFKCWQNRLKDEAPQLFKALNKEVFCHHTKAVEQFLKLP